MLNLKVHVVLIDNRYSADFDEGDLLGESQWEWLESIMRTTEADVTILAAGLMIHATEYLDFRKIFTETPNMEVFPI